MSNYQQLSNGKSLEIIHQIINQAKKNITGIGHSWFLWGTMIFLASLSNYFFVPIGYGSILIGYTIPGLLLRPRYKISTISSKNNSGFYNGI